MFKVIFSILLVSVFAFVLSASFDVSGHFGVIKTINSNTSIDNCTKVGCAGYKGSCSLNCSNAQIASGFNSSCCPHNLWCLSGTCQRSNIGDDCSSTNNCLPDLDGTLLVNCSGGACTEVYGAGDTCTSSSDCQGGLTCNNSICVGSGLTAPCQPFYTTIISDYPIARISECAAPNYCDPISSTCVAPATTSCGISNIFDPKPCNQTSVCNHGTCIQIASLSVIGSNASTPLACGNNLAWNNASQTCVAAPSDTLISCSTSSQTADCAPLGNGATCNCFPQSGNTYCTPGLIDGFVNTTNVNYYTSELLILAQCLQEYNCSYNGIMALAGDPVYNANSAPDSCTYQNCWSAYKKYKGQGCSDADDKYGSCFYSPECGGFPIWAIVVIVIVAVILVLAVVIVIFLVLRRRKDYASI